MFFCVFRSDTSKIERIVYEIFSTFGGPIRALCYIGPDSFAPSGSTTSTKEENADVHTVLNQEELLFTGSHPSKTIKKWDVNSGQVVGTFTGHLDDVVAFCYNETFLFSGTL